MPSLHLGDFAPDFEQNSSLGPIRFHEWLGDKWAVLFSHPADFTPVCTTELGLTANLHEEFARRGVKVIALSVDPVESHVKWIDDINSTQGVTVNFPIIADADRKVSLLYDLIHRPGIGNTAMTSSLCRRSKTPTSSGRNSPKAMSRCGRICEPRRSRICSSSP